MQAIRLAPSDQVLTQTSAIAEVFAVPPAVDMDSIPAPPDDVAISAQVRAFELSQSPQGLF